MAAGTATGGSCDPAAMEAIAAALQLFDLCRPAEDSTISAEDLAKVLRSHLGGEAEVERILGLLSDGSNSGRTPHRFNFLTYWGGMDRFFQEAGAFPAQNTPVPGEMIDTIKGMQRFRDGVLTIARVNGLLSEQTISSLHLLELLKEIRAVATDPNYWEEVMQAVPAEEGFGLTLPEVAEAVYIWLKDFLRGELEASGNGVEPEEMSPLPLQVEEPISPDVGAAHNATEEPDSPGPRSSNGKRCLNRTMSGMPLEKSSVSRGSLMEGLGPDLAGELRRAHELNDLIAQRTPEENAKVHQSLAHLAIIYDSIFSTLLGRQREVERLETEVSTVSHKKESLEAEVARTAHYAGELDGRFETVERERDESVRKVTGLESQVRDLTRQCDSLQQALKKTEAQHASHEEEVKYGNQKSMCAKSRMDELERQADSAEGRAEWMRVRLERLKTRFAAASQAAKSYANCVEEEDEVKSLLQAQLLEGATKREAPPEEVDKQLKLQLAQLQRLRQVRDDLLKAHDGWAERKPSDGACSPRELQVHRRCSFLAGQLQALLQHTAELETLMDNEPGNSEVEEKQLKSVKRFAADSQKTFEEFSEKLHTLEVQKADVDQELRRLQQRFAEQEGQLRGVQRHRDQLLVEAGSSPGGKVEDSKKIDNSDAGSSASGAAPRGFSGGFLFDGARPGSSDLRASPKTGDEGGKVPRLKNVVRGLVDAQYLTGTDATRARARGESPQRARPNPLVFNGFSMGATSSIQPGQWRRTGEREKSAPRQKDDKSARREHKDKKAAKEHKEPKEPKDKDKAAKGIRGKLKEAQETGLRGKLKEAQEQVGNCETQ